MPVPLTELTYYIAGSGRRRTANFNESTGAITNPKQWLDTGTPEVAIGETVYSNTDWVVRATGDYPYFFIEYAPGGGSGSCTISDLDATVISNDDGSFNGSKLPNGPYYYVVMKGGTKEEYKGTITLLGNE